MRACVSAWVRGGHCASFIHTSRVSLVQEKRNVATVVKTFNLSQTFVDMSYGVFQQLDLDKNGAIDQE